MKRQTGCAVKWLQRKVMAVSKQSWYWKLIMQTSDELLKREMAEMTGPPHLSLDQSCYCTPLHA